MGVSETEFKKLYARNTTAAVVCRNAFNSISGIRVQVKGIVGGNRAGANTILWYEVFIDVDSIRAAAIPVVYVLSPPESNIRHVNVYHPRLCAKLGRRLPEVCLGGYKDYWTEQDKHNRTLVSLIQCVESVLQNQNFDSMARTNGTL